MWKKTIQILSLTAPLLLCGCHSSEKSSAPGYASNTYCANIVQKLHQFKTAGNQQQKTMIEQAKLLDEYQYYGCDKDDRNPINVGGTAIKVAPTPYS